MIYNTNNRSVTINLKSDRGLGAGQGDGEVRRCLYRELAPGAVELLGLGQKEVLADWLRLDADAVAVLRGDGIV